MRYLGLALAVMTTLARAAAAAPCVADVVGSVNRTCYSAFLNSLPTQCWADRGMHGAQHDVTTDVIFSELKRLGLRPYKERFVYPDLYDGIGVACNVIAVKAGVTHPDEVYVAGAHYDSKSNPGADDNASGCAALLEMARVLRGRSLDRTLVFAFFDGEEATDTNGVHRLGSCHYAAEHATDNIRGMISVDMIAWKQPGWRAGTASIEGRTSMAPITLALIDAVSAYGDGLRVRKRYGAGDYSDHVAFANAGFQAVQLIEWNWYGNPNYHKAGDTTDRPGYIDLDYATRMTRSALGYFATAAGVAR